MTDGVLDRKKLGRLVFSDESALLALNAITHAAVKREVVRMLTPRPALAAIDAIGLFEGELAELCYVTVGVLAPEEGLAARPMRRVGIWEAYARSRIRAQHPDEWFREKCDYILENGESDEAFCRKCLAFLEKLAII